MKRSTKQASSAQPNKKAKGEEKEDDTFKFAEEAYEGKDAAKGNTYLVNIRSTPRYPLSRITQHLVDGPQGFNGLTLCEYADLRTCYRTPDQSPPVHKDNPLIEVTVNDEMTVRDVHDTIRKRVEKILDIIDEVDQNERFGKPMADIELFLLRK